MRLINQENCLEVIEQVLAAERAAREAECSCPSCMDERWATQNTEAA